MLTRIKFRRDTSDNWNNVNPVLAAGEPGYEIDTHRLKVGDGSTDWQNLPYISTTTSTLSNLSDVDDSLATGNDAYVLSYDTQTNQWIAKDVYSIYPSEIDGGNYNQVPYSFLDAGTYQGLYNYVLDGGFADQQVFTNQDSVMDGGTI